MQSFLKTDLFLRFYTQKQSLEKKQPREWFTFRNLDVATTANFT